MPRGPVDWGRRCPKVAARPCGWAAAPRSRWCSPCSSPSSAAPRPAAPPRPPPTPTRPPAPPPPTAAWAARARALQAKLDAQHAEVERLAERLNATDDRRHRLQQRLAKLKARREAAQRQLETAQQRFDEQVRATYMNGPQWLLGELGGGANPSGATRHAPVTQAAPQ